MACECLAIDGGVSAVRALAVRLPWLSGCERASAIG